MIAFTVGVGLTTTLTLFVPEQPFAVIVYTYTTVIGAFVVFVSVSETSPVPDPAASVIPVTAALVQVNPCEPLDNTVFDVAV